MPDVTDEFGELLRRARSGDSAALAELVRHYEPEVRIVARATLGPALRPYLDSMDVLQSVHRSLILGLQGQKFEITRPENLVALAAIMVRRKVARHWRRQKRQERLSLGPAESANLPALLAGVGAANADPAQAAEYNEALEKLTRSVDADERRLIELRLQGCSTADAARELGLDPDVLRVRLHRLRLRLRAAGVLTEWL